MCMKYINAIATCYSSISTVDNHITSLNAPLYQLEVEDKNNPYISDFSIVTRLNFLGTSRAVNEADNILLNGESVDLIIRLTKCDKEENKRLGYDIDNFSIDLSKVDKDVACFEFYNYMRITNVKKISLPAGLGKYV